MAENAVLAGGRLRWLECAVIFLIYLRIILTLFQISYIVSRKLNGGCIGRMQNSQPTDLIRVAEARELLGVSNMKIAQLIKDGHIRYFPYLLDKRVKLVSKREVMSLKKERKVA
jgi:predicted DNA-binding transcriptional regulator AlpA